MTRDLRRRSRAAVGAAALALALSGCLSVPHSGRVQGAGGNASTPASGVPNEARIEAPPPAPGEEPDQIVKDFYGAMVDYGPDHVALKYQVRDSPPWPDMPKRTVVVSDVGDPEPSATAPRTNSHATFVLHFTKLGEVLPDHEFVVGTETLTDTVDVVRDPGSNNDWRISRILSTDGGGRTVPDVLRLSVTDFNTVFHEATLYFPRVGKDPIFVADRRWFPRRRADLPAAIAQAYVDGPSDFLKPDVTIAALFPPGSSTESPGQLAAGLAGFAFKVPGDANSDALRTHLTEAVKKTLSQREFADVTRIVVTVNGDPGPPTAPASLATDAPPQSTVTDAWFIDGRQVLRPWFDTSTSTDGAPDTPARIDVTGMDRVSLAPSMQLAAGAVAAADGSRALRVVSRDAGEKDVALHASSLTSVRWNADGTGLWVAGAVGGRAAGAALPAVGGKPAVDAVPAVAGTAAAWFVTVTVEGEGASASLFVDAKSVAIDPQVARTGSALLDLRPSPDGVRISAIVQNAGKKRSDLFVGRIDKSSGVPAIVTVRRVAPVLLQPPKDKPAPSFTVAVALWDDAEQLVLVARQGTSTYSLWNATFDGSTVEPRNTSGLVNISEATVFTIAHGKQILALDNAPKRQVYSLSGGTWQPVSARDDKAKVFGLMYPG